MKKLIAISTLLVFCTVCFSQNVDWNKAKQENTVESYQDFLDNYPSSEYSESAKSALLELEFNKIKNNNSIEDYYRYMKKYPDSEFSLKADIRIQELKHSISKLNKFKVGVTTESYFLSDGWNFGDPWLGKIGIVKLKKTPGRAEYKLGICAYFILDKAFENLSYGELALNIDSIDIPDFDINLDFSNRTKKETGRDSQGRLYNVEGEDKTDYVATLIFEDNILVKYELFQKWEIISENIKNFPLMESSEYVDIKKDIHKQRNTNSKKKIEGDIVYRSKIVHDKDEPPLYVNDRAQIYESLDGIIPYSKDDIYGFINDSIKKVILEISFNPIGMIGYRVYPGLEPPSLENHQILPSDIYLGISKTINFRKYVFINNLNISWERVDKRIENKRYAGERIHAQKYKGKKSDPSKIEFIFDVERDEFTHISMNGYGFDFSDYPFKKVWIRIPMHKNFNSRHKKITILY